MEDCLTVYFSSARGGTLDLFVARRTSVDERFETPQRSEELTSLDDSLNQIDPWVSPDERRMLFVVADNQGIAYDLAETTR